MRGGVYFSHKYNHNIQNWAYSYSCMVIYENIEKLLLSDIWTSD